MGLTPPTHSIYGQIPLTAFIHRCAPLINFESFPRPCRAMVQYEIALILRAVPLSDFHQVLRGVCTVILQQNALLRGMENLGKRELPYKISAHEEKFSQGR